MTSKRKLELLEDMMELDAGTLKPETILDSLEEWDSIAVISFIALLDDEFNKTVKGGTVKAQKTVSGLMTLMEAE